MEAANALEIPLSCGNLQKASLKFNGSRILTSFFIDHIIPSIMNKLEEESSFHPGYQHRVNAKTVTKGVMCNVQ